MPEADLAVIHELDAGLLTRDARDLGADLALQHAVDVSVIDIDESGRAAGGRDFRRDDFLGVRTAGGDLDRAEPVLLDILGVAAELAGGEMLRLDTAAALFVEDLRPALEGVGQGRTDGFRMAHAADEFLLRAGDRRADEAQGSRRRGALDEVAPAKPRSTRIDPFHERAP